MRASNLVLVAIALAVFAGFASSSRPMTEKARLLKSQIRAHLRSLPVESHGHNVRYKSATPPCAYITGIKWGTPQCTGSQTPITIIPNECLVQFGSGGVSTDIIYLPATDGKTVVRFVYTGSAGVCGNPDKYAYQDLIQPGQCLEGWTYTWNTTLPACWLKWQEYDKSSTCESSKLGTTTYMEPNQCFYDQKFGLTWGLMCKSKTSAESVLYQQKAGVCSGVPYQTYANGSCISAFATGVQFRATYNCP